MCTRDDDTFDNETSFQGSRYALAFAASGLIFFFSLSLSLGGSNLFFEGKNASGKDFNVSKRHVYESLNNEFYRSKLPEDV